MTTELDALTFWEAVHQVAWPWQHLTVGSNRPGSELRRRLLVFGLLAVFCAAISVSLAFMRDGGDTTLPPAAVSVVMAIIFFLGSLWAFGLRLVLKRTSELPDA